MSTYGQHSEGQVAMSFENAGVSKGSFLKYFPFQQTNSQNQGLIVTFALTSISAGIFDIKHYFHLQVSEIRVWTCSH